MAPCVQTLDLTGAERVPPRIVGTPPTLTVQARSSRGSGSMIGEGLMAGISGSPDVTVTQIGVERDALGSDAVARRHAWLSVGIAAWLVGAFVLIVWAFGNAQVP